MPADPFADPAAYVRLAQIRGLALAPDGSRLVASVAVPDEHGSRYVTALWEIDPEGLRPARQLTHGPSASTPTFTPAGDLLYLSARREPDSDSAGSALWCQQRRGGDAYVLATAPGGVFGVVVSSTGTVVLGTGMLPSAADAADDQRLRGQRRRAGISAMLHEEYPIRYWDHDLGPARVRLLTGELGSGQGRLELRDLTGHVGRALGDESTWDLSADGRTVAAIWAVAEPGGSQRHTLVAIDVPTGERRVLADDPDHEYHDPRFSPDGSRIVVRVFRRLTRTEPGTYWLGVVAVAGGPVRALTATWDRWPVQACWQPDGVALVVTADHHGRRPLWRVDADSGEVRRLTTDQANYLDPLISPDGRWSYARRAAVDSPPRLIRLANDPAAGGVEYLRDPAESLGGRATIPGRLTEVEVTVADGARVRGWLALPAAASPSRPAPLVVWLHGGPTQSSNRWRWSWNPWPVVAAGYAVLLPDFAMSTGYGLEFIRRGWGSYGGAPYTDVLAITEAAAQRNDIDANRAAVVGTSYGGYLANWIAGHTDRFGAIVSQASVWNLDLGSEADIPYFFAREMSDEAALANSPHRFADAISTPMLVVHGGQDYRVPVSEAHRLWWDLMSRIEPGVPNPHKFLYFPQGAHFVNTPGDLALWYTTVLAFLATHLRGEPWQRPELLG